MLTAVKNQWRVCLLSLKYNMMRQMLNKVSFKYRFYDDQ